MSKNHMRIYVKQFLHLELINIINQITYIICIFQVMLVTTEDEPAQLRHYKEKIHLSIYILATIANKLFSWTIFWIDKNL